MGRKLFDPSYNYPDSDDGLDDEEERRQQRAKRKQENNAKFAEVPISFTHKLFDAKTFGSPTSTKTPRSKSKEEFKTPAPPSTTKKTAGRKTPFGSSQPTALGEGLKSFKHYSFLKSLDGMCRLFMFSLCFNVSEFTFLLYLFRISQ